jgi:hypothetical protein
MKLFKVRVGEVYVAAYYRDNRKATTTRYSFLKINHGDKFYRAFELTEAGLIAVPYEVSIEGDTAIVYPNGADIYTSLAKGFIEFLTGQYIIPAGTDEPGNYKFYIRDKD